MFLIFKCNKNERLNITYTHTLIITHMPHMPHTETNINTQNTKHSTQYYTHITYHSTQHTAHSTQHTVHSTQHTAHSTQHTAHSTQHTPHTTHHTPHTTHHKFTINSCCNDDLNHNPYQYIFLRYEKLFYKPGNTSSLNLHETNRRCRAYSVKIHIARKNRIE